MSKCSDSGVPGMDTFCTTFHKLAAAVDSPFSLKCDLLLSSGDPDDLRQLVSLTADPRHYREGDEAGFAGDYLMAKIASKLPPEFGSWNRLEPTLKQFCEQEDHNAKINRQVLTHQVQDALEAAGISISLLRKVAKSVLGKAPSLKHCCEMGGWGPGSTVLHSRDDSVPEAKCADTSVTYRLATALQQHSCCDVIPWWNQVWTLVPGNLMFTVTKNAKTDRTASAEPAINGWVQKGLGACMRRKLRKVGIDLNDQTNNQLMALLAQRLGYATIDLRGASNSIALEIIRLVLPTDWMYLIDVTRSERGAFDSRANLNRTFWFEYEMVSSMGNGFTFELESLLFYCISRAAGCHSDEVWVYGDDIIIPQERVTKVVEGLQICGFSVNTEKSFTEGLFFESCGVHVFNGCDVTPFYIKELLHEPKDVLRIANELRLFATRLDQCQFPHRQFLPIYRYLVGRLPTPFRTRGPAFGGLCLFSNIEEFHRSKPRFDGLVEYDHLMPCFTYQLNDAWSWTYEQCLAEWLDFVQGPLPLVSGQKTGHRTMSLTKVRNLQRRYKRAGLGETPFLSQYRLFTMSSSLHTNPWEDVCDAANKGNSVARVKYRKWSKYELDEMSKSDRNRAGSLAHKVVSGSVDPGRVATLTAWGR